MGIKNIVFDVGKVLVYFEPEWIMNKLGFDEETKAVLRKTMFEDPLWNEVDRGVMTTDELVTAFAKNAPAYEKEIRETYLHVGDSIELLPHAVEWTASLKERGYHLYIISNYGEYTLEQTKDKMDFLQYMDGAIFSYQYQIIKPDARIYEQLLKNYDLQAKECVFIDDKAENVEGAKAVGYQGVVFTTYEEVQENLEEILRG